MKQFAVIALLMLLFACSKYARNEKNLPGSWKVDVVRIEDGEGFIFYDSLATGSFAIMCQTLWCSTKVVMKLEQMGKYCKLQEIPTHYEQKLLY
jgi:hypothetical protein